MLDMSPKRYVKQPNLNIYLHMSDMLDVLDMWMGNVPDGMCSMDENGDLNSANVRLQKWSSQVFNQKFSAQMIKI